MCLAIPGKVLSVKNGFATIEYPDGSKRNASTFAVAPKKGEYALVQAGMVVLQVSKKEAQESIKAWNELEKKQ